MKKGEIIFFVAVSAMILLAAYFFYAGYMGLFSEKYEIKEETEMLQQIEMFIPTPPAEPTPMPPWEQMDTGNLPYIVVMIQDRHGKSIDNAIAGVWQNDKWFESGLFQEQGQSKPTARWYGIFPGATERVHGRAPGYITIEADVPFPKGIGHEEIRVILRLDKDINLTTNNTN